MKVYLDNAATTALRPQVINRMTEVLQQNFGNASSTHAFGRNSKALLEQCRKSIASYLNASAAEIIFTSGGTEADNLVLRSAVTDLKVKRIITSKTEHHAVLHVAEQLKVSHDITLEFVNIDGDGSINLEHLKTLLEVSEAPTLVSLMHINNEIGNMINLKEVANLVKSYNAYFHSDTVQSVGHYSIDLEDIPIDFMVASAHKFHGPKGIGFCFVRKGAALKATITGGAQERGLRAGTEALHNIVGMTEALQLAYDRLEEEQNYISDLKLYFIQELKKAIPQIKFNGRSANENLSTYTILNIQLPQSHIDASMLQFQLDLRGIACSRGSACQSGSTKASHVLSAFLDAEELKLPNLRFSLSKNNTKEELDYVVETLSSITSR